MAAPVPRLLVVLLTVLATAWPGHARAQSMSEYQAKAAFILNVLAFVEWPEAALAQGAPIEVAVVGRASGTEVQAALTGKTARRHPLTVHVYDRASDVKASHVLFLTADAGGDARGALQSVDGKAVLTIVDETVGSSLPSVITLLIVDRRLAFTVDLDVADANGVRPSAHLLRLAHRVRGRRLATTR
jgi:hypothetical protein